MVQYDSIRYMILLTACCFVLLPFFVCLPRVVFGVHSVLVGLLKETSVLTHDICRVMKNHIFYSLYTHDMLRVSLGEKSVNLD